MKPHHSHAKSSINQMSAFSIFTQKAHKKPVKLLKVSDIDQKYKQHMMSPLNRKYQIKFSLPEILKKDFDPPLSSRKIGNDPSFNSIENSCENRYRTKTKEISLNSPHQGKFINSLSPVSQSRKANNFYPSENITFEPLKKVLPRTLKPLKHKEIEDYEVYFNEKTLKEHSLTSLKKLDTEETSNVEGLTLDQFLESNIPLDKWHKQSSSPFPANHDQSGLDRYGLKLTPIMSEISRDSRDGARRSQYNKSKRMLVDFGNSPTHQNNQSVTPKADISSHKKKPSASAFKIEIENKESFSPIAAMKSVPETKKFSPSKPTAGHYSHKNSRSSTMVRKYVIDEAAISPTEGLNFSEYFQDFVVDKKGFSPLVLSGTRIGATSNDTSDYCLEEKMRTSKRDENQFRKSRTKLGSFTSLDSKSNVVDTMHHQKVSDILNLEERRTSKCWNIKNVRKSIDNSEPLEQVKSRKNTREGGLRQVRELIMPKGNQSVVRPGDFLKKIVQQQKSFC